MINTHESSSKSTQQLVTPGAGNLKGLPSGGAGGGDKPPRNLCRMKSVHELDNAAHVPAVPTTAGGNEYEPFQCSLCESFFISEVDLQCHIRRCHVHRSWRRGKEDAPRPAPSVEKQTSLGGHGSSSNRCGKKGCAVVSKQKKKQLTDETAAPEAPARPVIDLNVPAPEVEEEKGSSG